MTPSVIRFYHSHEPYYEFTNFFAAPFTIKGKTWPTSEHFFHAKKFSRVTVSQIIQALDAPTRVQFAQKYMHLVPQFDQQADSCSCKLQRENDNACNTFALHSNVFQDITVKELVRALPTPRDAFNFVREMSQFRRKDWEQIKVEKAMKPALYAKFTQNPVLKKMLLDTGEAELVEHTVNDRFWGDGGDGTGKNMLGNCLMDLRKRLRNEERTHYEHSISSKHCLLPSDEQLSDTKQKFHCMDDQVRRSALEEGSMNSVRETSTTNFDFSKQDAGLGSFDEVKTYTTTTTTTSAPSSHST